MPTLKLVVLLGTAAVLAPTRAARADVAPPIPTIVTGVVEPATDGTTGAGFAWRAWPLAAPGSVAESAPDEGVGLSRPGGFYGAPTTSWGGAPGVWVVAIEGVVPSGSYFAVTQVVRTGGPQAFPATRLVAMPEPSAATDGANVRVDWPLVGGPGVTSCSVLRSKDAEPFTEVARVAGTSWTDAAPVAGSYRYALRLVYAGGVDGRVMTSPTDVVVVVVDPPRDSDSDSVADASDNCAMFANPGQEDSDHDGLGNACEIVFGDVAPRGAADGRVDVADVVRTLRFTVGLEGPTVAERRAANVAPASIAPGAPDLATPTAAQPEVVDIGDVVLLLRTVVGLTRLAPPR